MEMRRPINYLIALSGLLSGCASAKTRSVEIPAANITAVYEPPSKTAISMEVLVAIILVAIVLYIIFEKAWFRGRRKKVS